MRRLLACLPAVVMTVVMTVLLPAGNALAAVSAGSVGYDVAYPQCGAPLPTDGAFGVVGVTDGLPWSTNPCLADQYAWAASRPQGAAFYLNTANPAPTSSYFWPASGSSAPALCTDATSTTDPGCAYDYGWHAAADAFARAASVTAAAATLPWWLDVESANSWNGDGWSNAADLQGAVDYLRSQGVPTVGFYATSGDWSAITGGYTVGTQSSYASYWASYWGPGFTTTGIAAAPDWVTGAAGYADATANCANSFTGGTVALSQYPLNGYDGDYACTGGASAPPPAPDYTLSATPASLASAPGGTATATIGMAGTGGWSAPVTLSATSAPAGVSASFSPGTTLAPGGSATLTVSAATAGSYTLTVTATPAGSGPVHSVQLSYVVSLPGGSPPPPPPPGDCNDC